MKQYLYRIKQKIKKQFSKPVNHRAIFEKGYHTFLQTGITPPEAYTSMIELYCSTNGKYLETFNQKLISESHSPTLTLSKNSEIVEMDKFDFNNLNSTLNKEGYFNLNKKLKPALVKRLVEFAYSTKAKTAPNYDVACTYDPSKPTSEIYRIDMQDLINNEDIQQLIMDPALITIAKNYLGMNPIFDFPAMWWTTAFSKEASAEAAQLYHFDLDRVKWLKIFIYLTDVTEETGPHRFIKGSHAVGKKPKELLKRGYARIPDEDLKPFYKPHEFQVYYGEAGSIFVGDTKCWHKGTPIKKGHRLVLEFEYTTSLFGTNYPKLEVKNPSQSFKEFCQKHPHFSSNLIFS